jgi:toxin ParE1/3/4
MTPYKLSVKASEDIEAIWLYTLENWSLEQADRYVDLIFDEIEYLAANPTAGRDCSHLRKNYRCSKVKLHHIFYRLATKENVVEIIRVLHERMDVENRLIE